MTAPRRIQRSRAKGWRMPDDAIYVGRPTRWGNPWRVNQYVGRSVAGEQVGCAGSYDPADPRWFERSLPGALTAEEAVRLYRDELLGQLSDGHEEYDQLRDAIGDLAGHDLVCWCPLSAPCHADVLLELSNDESLWVSPWD